MNKAFALRCAQYQANKTGKPEVIYRASNGQWMTAGLDQQHRDKPKPKMFMVQTVYPKKEN